MQVNTGYINTTRKYLCSFVCSISFWVKLHKNYKDFLVRCWVIGQELCESWGGCPELSVLTSILVSMDVKNYWTMLWHWSQLVPNMSTDIWGHHFIRCWTHMILVDCYRHVLVTKLVYIYINRHVLTGHFSLWWNKSDQNTTWKNPWKKPLIRFSLRDHDTVHTMHLFSLIFVWKCQFDLHLFPFHPNRKQQQAGRLAHMHTDRCS